ncbi:MAG: trigger factor [Bacteroidales bacterium]|jgi:trigger factor|nr:trigger factor [Bacteroidales bacterium]
MKVSKEMTGDLTAVIKIEVEENDYKERVEKELRDYRKKANIPGFRPGQVPLGMVKKMYERPVRAEEIQKLMSDNLYKYIEDNQLRVLGSPLADNEKTKQVDWDNEKEFAFYFDIALQPKFTVDLTKEKLTLYDVEPTEEMLDKFIEDVRYRFGKIETPETIGESDMLYGHLEELDEQGNKKEGGVDTNTTIFVDKIALETIKKKFIGKKKDDVITFKIGKAIKDASQLASIIKLPIDKVKEFTADTKFTVLSIQRMNKAEMNEDFFNKAYKDKGIKTEEEFRKNAKEDLSKTYAREADSYFLHKAMESITKNTKFDIPVEFLKRWLVETSEDKLDAKSVEENFSKYENGIRWQLIEGELSKTYKLDVTNDEIKNYYKTELFPSYFPVPEKETKQEKDEREKRLEDLATNMLQNRDQSKQVFDYLFEGKLIKCLKENIKFDTKKINIDEFTKEIKKDKETK